MYIRSLLKHPLGTVKVLNMLFGLNSKGTGIGGKQPYSKSLLLWCRI